MGNDAQPRRYFSERQGRGPKAEPLSFESLRRLVISVFESFRERGYMQEAFGINCWDGDKPGNLGSDLTGYFERTIGRNEIWPYWFSVRESGVLRHAYDPWDADTLFDVIEAVHDQISKPLEGQYHDYNDCGMHYETFDGPDGRLEFRAEINAVIRLSDPPYELDEDGEIIELAPPEFARLLGAPIPQGADHDLIVSRLDAAISRFRIRGATIDDRRHAVRDLADVLEALRSDLKAEMLSADESALFHLANGFAIRHNNREQQGDYDRVTWLRWAFYVYLATIHAVLRVRENQDNLGQSDEASS